jgi:hypothetical protein
MNFDQIRERYYAEFTRACDEWNKFNTARRKGLELPPDPKPVNYVGIEENIIGALMTELGFTKREAGFIQGQAYADKHACFADVIVESERLGRFIREFERLNR